MSCKGGDYLWKVTSLTADSDKVQAKYGMSQGLFNYTNDGKAARRRFLSEQKRR